MSASRTPVRRLIGTGLGLFVVWQITFLIGSNVLRLAEDVRCHLREVPVFGPEFPEWVCEDEHVPPAWWTLQRVPRRWSELTAQPQNWALFAPTVSHHVVFHLVELRWDDERLPPLRLPSDNEPADRRHFLRHGHFRLRRYESNIELVLTTGDRPREEVTDHWRARIEAKLRDEGDSWHAYLRWRLAAFQRRHPGLPMPQQVILFMRTHAIPPPPGPRPWDWQEPCDPLPVVRWLPWAEPGPEYYLLEMYNPVVERFERLRRPG
jgi:hypothetical protein